ncbi:MAG: exodeoxyribonuclease III [Acidobacteria bacterium]|nr:MAG: exodeoxyribonuclease III [Acidobacteriota bacterium]
MRIATWNVNGLRARLEFVLEWLRRREPDLVGLQELKLTDDQFPHEPFRELGYQALVHGQKAWNGVAILAKFPIEETARGLPGQEDAGARLLAARSGSLHFVTVYVPNGKAVGHEDFERKLAWFDSLSDWLARAYDPDRPLVVCGDFNVVPEPLDSWNEEMLAGTIFHTDEERARVARLREWGLVDLFRTLHPGKRAFSWWDYRGGAFHRGQGLRIDLVLGTRPVAAWAREATIDREFRKKQRGLTPSDHAPVIVELAADGA